MANFKCESCGKFFQQDKYSESCPDCKIKGKPPIKSSKTNFIFGVIITLIAVIITAVIYLVIDQKYYRQISDLFITSRVENEATPNNQPEGGLSPESQSKIKMVYEVWFQPFNDGVAIVFYERALIGNGKYGTKTWVADQKKAQQLISAYSFDIFDSKGNALTLYDNKFYPCNRTDIISVSWMDNVSYPLYKSEHIFQQVNFTLESEMPNRMACNLRLEIIDVQLLSSCRIRVITNFDNLKIVESVKISVNGRNGWYGAQRIFNARNIKTYNVWAIYGSDTIEYDARNGNQFTGIDCIIVLPDLEKIVQAGNAYGANPNNTNLLEKFFSLPGISRNNTVFYIDSQNIGQKANLENNMRVNFQNEGKTYIIDPEGVIISDTKVTEIRFLTN